MSEYNKQYTNDNGYKIDASKTQERLADEALKRSEDKLDGMAEDVYMAAFYPKDHDEYLVHGAMLTCSMATTHVKVLRGVIYNVKSPDNTTILNVTENPQAKCCNNLYHATVKDRKVEDNITPFRCNCKREPHNDAEWEKLKSDESCESEGTCKALINLNGEWDNLPAEVDYLRFWNEDRQGMVQGITMSSMLFCRHGGIIIPVTSGQIIVKELELSSNAIALVNTSLEPATAVKLGTQKLIQNLCVENGVIYFDENGYQRVKYTELSSDPYLVAIAEYYQKSAIEEKIGDEQGYGAIFRVTYDSGKEIFVTMGDLKAPSDTMESMQNEGKNYYAGSGDSANTLEFFCNFVNENPILYSDNMSGKKGSDANMGKAITITEGAKITNIQLLKNKEIAWDKYFEE